MYLSSSGLIIKGRANCFRGPKKPLYRYGEWVFYKSRLIPRWLSIWGLLGGILYFIAPMFGMFGFDLSFLMLPVAVQEMAMALWLIIKGFNPNSIASVAEK